MTLHNSFAKVGNTPVGIGEGVGWNRRFVSTIQLLDTVGIVWGMHKCAQTFYNGFSNY